MQHSKGADVALIYDTFKIPRSIASHVDLLFLGKLFNKSRNQNYFILANVWFENQANSVAKKG